MITLKQVIAVGLVVAVVIAAGYMVSSSYTEYKPGEIVPTISIKLTEVATGHEDIGTITPPATILPFTAVTSTLYSVVPTSTYIVEFNVDYRIVPPEGIASENLHGYATLTGLKDNGDPTATKDLYMGHINPTGTLMGLVTTPETQLVNYSSQADFTVESNTMFDGMQIQGASAVYPLLGSYLGGSVWTLRCYAATDFAGTGAYAGSTVVTINMVLGGENLTITVDDIEVTGIEV